MLFFLQNMMMSTMLYSLTCQEAEYFQFPENYAVYIVKCPCVIALHFVLYPEVNHGMTIMKYANNHHHKFILWGSEISFCIGFIQFMTAIYCYVINCVILAFQHEVEVCIVHFIALHVIMEIPNYYLESMGDNPILGVCHHPPTIDVRGSSIRFSDRTTFHKVARVVYKGLRSLYVSVVFYMVPFATFAILQFGAGFSLEHEPKTHKE